MAFLIPIVTSVASAIGGALGVGGTAAAGAAGVASTGFSLGSILSVGSGLLGAVGAIQQGQAAASAAKYNAQVQEQQAQIEQNQAAARATETATRTRQRLAGTRAAALQSGFELDGSVADILNTVETQGSLEGLTALYDGTVRAQGLRNSANLSRSQARGAITSSYINAGGSLLSGFSKAYLG